MRRVETPIGYIGGKTRLLEANGRDRASFVDADVVPRPEWLLRAARWERHVQVRGERNGRLSSNEATQGRMPMHDKREGWVCEAFDFVTTLCAC